MPTFKTLVGQFVPSFVVAVGGFFVSGTGMATTDGNFLEPQLKEGQMFTVRLVPASNKIEVVVAGNSVAKLKMDDVGVMASLRVGKKTWIVTPSHQQGHFVIEAPKDVPNDSKLDLDVEVKSQSKVENFKFKDIKIQTTQP